MSAQRPDRNLALELVRVTEAAAIAVIAVAERGTMFFPGAAVYMEKIAVGPQGIDAIDITAPAADNVRAVAEAKGVSTREISVVVLERDRHDELIGDLRDAGAKV